MAAQVLIAPSILAADFARLGEEVKAIDEAGCDWVHVDVMDGHFVPNITFGPRVVEAIRPWTKKPLDVHLMIAPCDPYLEAFAEAGSDTITVHAEAGPHLDRSAKDRGQQTCILEQHRTGDDEQPAHPNGPHGGHHAARSVAMDGRVAHTGGAERGEDGVVVGECALQVTGIERIAAAHRDPICSKRLKSGSVRGSG